MALPAQHGAEPARHAGDDRRGRIEDLLVKIPAKARLARPLRCRRPLAESDLVRHLRGLAAKNADADGFACFLGAGATITTCRARSITWSCARVS